MRGAGAAHTACARACNIAQYCNKALLPKACSPGPASTAFVINRTLCRNSHHGQVFAMWEMRVLYALQKGSTQGRAEEGCCNQKARRGTRRVNRGYAEPRAGQVSCASFEFHSPRAHSACIRTRMPDEPHKLASAQSETPTSASMAEHYAPRRPGKVASSFRTGMAAWARSA